MDRWIQLALLGHSGGVRVREYGVRSRSTGVRSRGLSHGFSLAGRHAAVLRVRTFLRFRSSTRHQGRQRLGLLRRTIPSSLA